jgi:predicted Zn finger-like uncharacterized protein
MQVSCPHCGTQYNLTAKQVGPAGRTLQCAKCKHKWFVAPAAPAIAAATDTLPPLPPSTTDMLASLDEMAGIGAAPGWWRKVRVGWGPEITLTLTGLGVMVLAVAGFNWLLRYQPADGLAAATQATGYTHQPGPQPAGLTLSHLTREITRRDANTLLIIHGTLTNDTSATAALPDLRVQLLDRNGVEIDYWPVSYATNTLAPRQNTAWQVTFVNPPFARVAAYRAFFSGGGAASPSSTSPLDSTPAPE